MKIAFVALLILHGAIHLIGFVKAFDLGKVAALREPVSRPMGALWLLAAAAFAVSAALFVWAPRAWWAAAAIALVVSQTLILRSWTDAKFGTLANLIVAVPVALALLDLRGSSFSSTYQREVARGLARRSEQTLVTEAEVAALPPLVGAYLRRVGVVGKPHVQSFRARMHGAIRSAPDAAWMRYKVEQHSFYDEPTRLFFMEASLYGLPFDVLHQYAGGAATMRVRVLSLVNVVDARGPEMTRAETVTLFNDLCFLAPAALLRADVVWKEARGRTIEGTFTNAGNTISATLEFDERGDLVGFVSNDRYRSSDGKAFVNVPWSTPVKEHRDFGGYRLMAYGEGVWKDPGADFVYITFTIDDIAYNVGR